MSQKFKGLTERYPAQLIMPVVDILAVISGCFLAYWWRFDNFNRASIHLKTLLKFHEII